uniref:Uncharacterized protein n=1 Tax=Salix viminalis TaxID=40686 RepID=A0A6N2MCI5_SALVM
MLEVGNLTVHNSASSRCCSASLSKHLQQHPHHTHLLQATVTITALRLRKLGTLRREHQDQAHRHPLLLT